MAEQGYRTLRVDGAGASTVTQQALEVLGARAELDVRHLAECRIGVSRTFRPTWALVLAIVLFPLGGVGLLFLLVKKTDGGEVVAVDGPTGTVVSVPPVVSEAAFDLLGQAVHHGPAPTLDPAPVVGPVVAPGAPSPPVHPGLRAGGDELVDDMTVRVSSATTARSLLVFEAGTIAMDPGDRVVLGRDPVATADSRRERVPGESPTVSKSHALVAFDGSRVTVRDLHSTNGTRLHDDGKVRVVGADEDVIVPAGARVELGRVSFAITLERPR